MFQSNEEKNKILQSVISKNMKKLINELKHVNSPNPKNGSLMKRDKK